MRHLTAFALAIAAAGALHAQPYGWVQPTCCQNGFVEVLNLPNDTHGGTFSLGTQGFTGVYSPDGTKFYLLGGSFSAPAVDIYSTSNFAFVGLIPLPPLNYYATISVSPDGLTLAIGSLQYGSTLSYMTSLVDIASLAVRGPFLIAQTQGVFYSLFTAFLPGGSQLIIGVDQLYKLDVLSGAVLATYPLPNAGTGVTSFALAPRGSPLYVISADATRQFTLARFDTVSGKFTATAPVSGLTPATMVISKNGTTLYVGGQQSASPNQGLLAAYSTKTLVQTKTVAVGQVVSWVALTPDGASAFTGDSFSATLSQLAIPSLVVRAQFLQLGQINGVFINPLGTQALVLSGSSGSLEQFSAKTHTIGPTITSGPNYRALPPLVSPDGKTVYVPGSGSIAAADTATHKIAGVLPGNYFFTQLALSPNGSKIYASTGSLPFSVIDVASKSEQLVGIANFFSIFTGITVSADGSRVYAPAPDGYVGVYDTTSYQLLADITGAHGNLSLSHDGKSLYVAPGSFPASTITVVSTATNAVTGTLTLPSPFSNAYAAHVVPSTTADIAYVTSCLCGTTNVPVIDTVHNVLLPSITVNDAIQNAAFTADGTKAYLVGANAIYEVQTSTGTITATIPGAYQSVAFKP